MALFLPKMRVFVRTRNIVCDDGHRAAGCSLWISRKGKKGHEVVGGLWPSIVLGFRRGMFS